MTFEMEMVDPPDLSELSWNYDSGRGRVLIETSRFAQGVGATIRVTATNDSDRPSGNVFIELDDGNGRTDVVYYEYTESEDQIVEWWNENFLLGDSTEPVTEEFTYYFDGPEIVSQYSDGVYSDTAPGDVTVRFGFEDGGPVAEATARLEPPDSAKVRENVRVTDLEIDTQNGTQPTITPTATIENPTNHGVDYPVTVTTQADGRNVNPEDVLIEDLSGAVGSNSVQQSTTTLPSVTLPRGTRRATVFIEPRDWAAEFGESYSESVNTDAPVPEDVQIVDCDMAQSQVQAPAEVEMAATVENPTPFRVETELTFTLGGRSETETVVLSPNERYTDRQPVAVLSPGTKQGSVEITRTREV